MKQSNIAKLLSLLLTTIVFISAANAGTSDVSKTKHNFSTSGLSSQNHEAGVSQVCIFCHTPHAAGKSGLLWNKANLVAATNFRLYTSSPSLTSVTRSSSLSVDSPSLLCLGCHDGKTAMNVWHSSGTGADAQGAGYPAGTKFISGSTPIPIEGPITGFFGEVLSNANLGRTEVNPTAGDNLTDDHPIGFSYSAVLTERATGLFTVAEASAKGVRFWGATNKVECTSCHDPHVDSNANPALKPFLVATNAGSALCLSCHNK